jgi:DNA-binding transcriptional LysR family regulator
MAISFDEIEAFLCIAELGGFTRASQKLNRTQPAISRRISQLEFSLGTALFERAGRVVQLTEAGEEFLPYAELALAAIEDGKSAVRDLVSSSGGTKSLSIALVGTLADSHVVDVLRAFEVRFPETTISLRTATSKEVSALVKRGEVQLGLRYFPDDTANLENIPLGKEALNVIVPAGHKIKADQLTTLDDLAAENWLGFPPERGQRESFGLLLFNTLVSNGIHQPRITYVDSLTAQKRLLEAGFGISLMPDASCREELNIGSLRKISIDNLDIRLPVVAVQRKDGFRSKVSNSFLTLLGELMPHLKKE